MLPARSTVSWRINAICKTLSNHFKVGQRGPVSCKPAHLKLITSDGAL